MDFNQYSTLFKLFNEEEVDLPISIKLDVINLSTPLEKSIKCASLMKLGDSVNKTCLSLLNCVPKRNQMLESFAIPKKNVEYFKTIFGEAYLISHHEKDDLLKVKFVTNEMSSLKIAMGWGKVIADLSIHYGCFLHNFKKVMTILIDKNKVPFLDTFAEGKVPVLLIEAYGKIAKLLKRSGFVAITKNTWRFMFGTTLNSGFRAIQKELLIFPEPEIKFPPSIFKSNPQKRKEIEARDIPAIPEIPQDVRNQLNNVKNDFAREFLVEKFDWSQENTTHYNSLLSELFVTLQDPRLNKGNKFFRRVQQIIDLINVDLVKLRDPKTVVNKEGRYLLEEIMLLNIQLEKEIDELILDQPDYSAENGLVKPLPFSQTTKLAADNFVDVIVSGMREQNYKDIIDILDSRTPNFVGDEFGNGDDFEEQISQIWTQVEDNFLKKADLSDRAWINDLLAKVKESADEVDIDPTEVSLNFVGGRFSGEKIKTFVRKYIRLLAILTVTFSVAGYVGYQLVYNNFLPFAENNKQTNETIEKIVKSFSPDDLENKGQIYVMKDPNTGKLTNERIAVFENGKLNLTNAFTMVTNKDDVARINVENFGKNNYPKDTLINVGKDGLLEELHSVQNQNTAFKSDEKKNVVLENTYESLHKEYTINRELSLDVENLKEMSFDHLNSIFKPTFEHNIDKETLEKIFNEFDPESLTDSFNDIKKTLDPDSKFESFFLSAEFNHGFNRFATEKTAIQNLLTSSEFDHEYFIKAKAEIKSHRTQSLKTEQKHYEEELNRNELNKAASERLQQAMFDRDAEFEELLDEKRNSAFIKNTVENVKNFLNPEEGQQTFWMKLKSILDRDVQSKFRTLLKMDKTTRASINTYVGSMNTNGNILSGVSQIIGKVLYYFFFGYVLQGLESLMYLGYQQKIQLWSSSFSQALGGILGGSFVVLQITLMTLIKIKLASYLVSTFKTINKKYIAGIMNALFARVGDDPSNKIFGHGVSYWMGHTVKFMNQNLIKSILKKYSGFLKVLQGGFYFIASATLLGSLATVFFLLSATIKGQEINVGVVTVISDVMSDMFSFSFFDLMKKVILFPFTNTWIVTVIGAQFYQLFGHLVVSKLSQYFTSLIQIDEKGKKKYGKKTSLVMSILGQAAGIWIPTVLWYILNPTTVVRTYEYIQALPERYKVKVDPAIPSNEFYNAISNHVEIQTYDYGLLTRDLAENWEKNPKDEIGRSIQVSGDELAARNIIASPITQAYIESFKLNYDVEQEIGTDIILS